jgi:hypothetical protein
MSLFRGRGHDDRFLLIFADTYPIERMEGHKALQVAKASDIITELQMSRSLTLI